MRDIGYLVRLYPEKTGGELVAIQEEEKLQEEIEFQKRNKRLLDYMIDLNTNGGYFKGKFGLDQFYYYKITALVMLDKGNIKMDVEKIIIFHGNRANDGITIERKVNEFQDFDKYSLQNEERVSVDEWNDINEYLNKITKKFW